MYARFIPNRGPELLHEYDHRPYCGQFSADGTLFYVAKQNFELELYETHHFRKLATIQARPGMWTITDCDLAPTNDRLVYSSINDTFHMVNVNPDSPDFGRHNDFDLRGEVGVWSLRLSADGREVVAGSNAGLIFVYDIEQNAVVHTLRAHGDDVNSVCFSDEGSNVLISGSDDSFVKVWDRRSLRAESSISSGVFIGHTEGITHVSSRWDGRYLVSNGKDQKMLLWDMRTMRQTSEVRDRMRIDCSVRGFDYRRDRYPGKLRKHPHDMSVRTFTGHKVLRTLIRCHFSPASTGHRYLYTGSADGRVFIFDSELDSPSSDPLASSTPSPPPIAILNPKSAISANNRNRTNRHFMGWISPGLQEVCIRDVAWHPYLPMVVGSTWTPSGGALFRFSCVGRSDDRDEEDASTQPPRAPRVVTRQSIDAWD
ncbi:WD40-repeat-containing domain protein [Zopfochytrium polystomum]|nr:WD40-repeat-containing domain protein [Zopfochytrium polystomum]